MHFVNNYIKITVILVIFTTGFACLFGMYELAPNVQVEDNTLKTLVDNLNQKTVADSSPRKETESHKKPKDTDSLKSLIEKTEKKIVEGVNFTIKDACEHHRNPEAAKKQFLDELATKKITHQDSKTNVRTSATIQETFITKYIKIAQEKAADTELLAHRYGITGIEAPTVPELEKKGLEAWNKIINKVDRKSSESCCTIL